MRYDRRIVVEVVLDFISCMIDKNIFSSLFSNLHIIFGEVSLRGRAILELLEDGKMASMIKTKKDYYIGLVINHLILVVAFSSSQPRRVQCLAKHRRKPTVFSQALHVVVLQQALFFPASGVLNSSLPISVCTKIRLKPNITHFHFHTMETHTQKSEMINKSSSTDVQNKKPKLG